MIAFNVVEMIGIVFYHHFQGGICFITEYTLRTGTQA
jgi:hypothetical protein